MCQFFTSLKRTEFSRKIGVSISTLFSLAILISFLYTFLTGANTSASDTPLFSRVSVHKLTVTCEAFFNSSPITLYSCGVKLIKPSIQISALLYNDDAAIFCCQCQIIIRVSISFCNEGFKITVYKINLGKFPLKGLSSGSASIASSSCCGDTLYLLAR